MRILAIDTSTSVLSIAVLEDDKIIVDFSQNKALTHSEKLLPSIEWILNISNLDIKDIDEFAVSVGPGSFTGIRIGVSVANAFAMVNNKGVVEISTLKALAMNIKNVEGIIVSTVYAQREDYYCSFYEIKNNEYFQLEEETVLSMEKIFENIAELSKNKKIYIVGEICFKEESKKYKDENILFATLEQNYVRSSNVCFLAKEELSRKCKQNKYAKPVYIRKSQAEEQYEIKEKGF